MKLIPYIEPGMRVPFGLSRTHDFYRLRLPAAVYYGTRYDIINDEMSRGWWCLNLNIRMTLWSGSWRMGWHQIGKRRRFQFMPICDERI